MLLSLWRNNEWVSKPSDIIFFRYIILPVYYRPGSAARERKQNAWFAIPCRYCWTVPILTLVVSRKLKRPCVWNTTTSAFTFPKFVGSTRNNYIYGTATAVRAVRIFNRWSGSSSVTCFFNLAIMSSIERINAPENSAFTRILSHATKVPGLVFLSGQTPVDKDGKIVEGGIKVGGTIVAMIIHF